MGKKRLNENLVPIEPGCNISKNMINIRSTKNVKSWTENLIKVFSFDKRDISTVKTMKTISTGIKKGNKSCPWPARNLWKENLS